MKPTYHRADIEPGDTCRDAVTGFEGIAVARTEWLHQCERITLQPPVGKDGKIPDTGTFDSPAIELVKKAKMLPAVRRTGGSQNDRAALSR